MIRELVDHRDFQSSYCFATSAPYAVLDRALFLRIEFAQNRGLASVCTPVAQTVLAR
jgi:hypothetical protein